MCRRSSPGSRRILISTVPASGGFSPLLIDGERGDRLPGSPRNQGTINLRYEMPVAHGWTAGFNYGVSGISNVLTRTGNRGNGEALPGFTVSNAAIDLKADAWTVTLYADNLFDKYAATGVRQSRAYLQTVPDIDENPVATALLLQGRAAAPRSRFEVSLRLQLLTKRCCVRRAAHLRRATSGPRIAPVWKYLPATGRPQSRISCSG